MKLYQKYCNILEEIGPVELAWFTTFNIDVELVERFLLSRLVGKPPQDLRTAEDFEGLNTELSAIDVKVWYDYRALNHRSPKRTTGAFYSIDPRGFYDSDSLEIIFHPKVVFLKGRTRAFVLAGSANLSIAAWSSNEESVLIKEIRNRKNADEVLAFFHKLHMVSGTGGQLPPTIVSWRDQLPDEAPEWHFVDNANEATTLFQHLGKGDLTVWSPYFSRDISGFVERLQKDGYGSVAFVPDISLTGGIRMLPEEILKLREKHGVRFLKCLQPVAEGKSAERLTHAKVWLSGERLAVGSWNCSFRATGLNKPGKEQNIEAGIVVHLQKKALQALLSRLEPLEPGQFAGTSAQALDAEWELALSPYTIDCKIEADWSDFTYKLTTDNPHLAGYTVVLPDEPKERVPLPAVNDRSYRNGFRKVLKNKQFVVFDEEGEEAFAGFLIELNTDKRQPFGYSNLFDLFQSLLNNPLGATSRQKCQYQLSEKDEYWNAADEALLEYRDQGSYYMMFVAFQKLLDAIIDNKDRPQQLEQIGSRLPGSLLVTTELVKESIHALGNTASEDQILYHYFMASELNLCIATFNSLTNSDLPKVEAEELIKRLKPHRKDLKFINKLKEEFKYVNV
jgi:hypothetical protein